MKRADQPIAEIIVRRGALRRYDVLTRKTSELPVRVSWDRRVDAEGTRHYGRDRRGPAPYTWTVADFVVIEE